mmetsp:Transcript_17478/g.37773  ORF Transcript_17478/g.37773 Transcript_17478/m.37773 type:complete len:486 (-) Transcript_17478:38-1495(-)|eukprot:CAMPEP_0202914670 /NCGR_PEP_ID=MMETSP1392-20130828/63663_1 /ASSEMBLY_ACC=CAM_ASM_000868 /TAXON_ID=225041 /ORGANISM="Chlamydomonas chlamydogama, Strain SAG 11-48b" /LENGTH=485 /DNA_ID=CAMNT_0049606407 /DNA_START=68 /DNA_END=1525 /DNA_ORIENTATION=+
MSGALAAKPTDKESEKGRVDKTKVKRYWPGRAPEWIDQQEDEVVIAAATRERTRTEVAAPVIVRKADDPRLRRLQQNRDEDREAALQRRREIHAAEIIHRRRADSEDHDQAEGRPGQDDKEEGDDRAAHRDAGLRRRHRSETPGTDEPESEDAGAREDEDEEPRGSNHAAAAAPEEDEEEVLRRRQAVRERLLQQRKEEEAAVAAQQEEEEEEEEEDSSEYETDSEDEAYGRRLLKPVFVPKESRETIAEREKLEEEEQLAAEKEKKRLEERKFETQQIVRERVAMEEQAARAASKGPAEMDDINTDDEAEAVEAYEAWKQRELRRIKRDREEKERQEKEVEERERLRNMTEEERAAWEKANPKAQQEAPKKKLKYLQKYYHKGAYFMDAPDDVRAAEGGYEIYARDYSAPTGEDRFDKSSMPAVMQVKNFGRSGRTKWTHLVAEDTTFAAGDPNDPLVESLKEAAKKRARATPQEFAKPKKFKA